MEHYDTTTYVADDDRITVRLPFKSEERPSNNFETAKQRLFAMEQKLKDHDGVKQQYRDFIKKFVDTGHLEQAPQTHGLCYYLPHHCVFKDSTTTKLRVVFDASSKSPNGNSLNDCLLLGPRLQDDVFDILILVRLHQWALSADVAKMYRQVALDKSDRDFHRILWRDYVTDEIRELRMTRVTYGVASSSYHSIRALQEGGKTNGPYPNIVNVILNDFWVDDLLSGADTLEEACVLQDDLIETLNKNCLPLRKWSSNQPQLVTRLPKDLQAGKAYQINDKTHQVKTPGLTWHPLEDHFVYASCSEYVSTITKLTLLSDVSKHFDPIGLITPVLVVATVIIQSCWKPDLEWNDALSKSKHALNIFVLYSDSTIALSWIKADPARWHTFVSNRVSQIQSMLPTTEFIHVPSEESPAALCLRGLLATQLVAQQKFWFQGPSLLE